MPCIRRWYLVAILLAAPLSSGCSVFQQKPPQPIATQLTPEQQKWWAENEHKRHYVPGKGYYVEGTSGYFDEQGRPVTSNLTSEGFADEEEEGGLFDSLSGEKMKKRYKKLVGRGPNEKVARAAFDNAEQLFREQKYKQAAKQYEVAYDRWPDSPLEEEALYKAAEAHYFADQYPAAEDAYEVLIKKYPGTPHLDSISKRRFSFAKYWEEYDRVHPHWPITFNAFDRTRPRFDTLGHSLRVYEKIRLDDPTGPLADDSIMATAIVYFVNGRYEDADYHFGLLRSEYAKSEHQFQAHLLGLKSKLLKYQGPDYEGMPLVEAEELAGQIMAQFPTELGAERDRMQKVRAEIRAQMAFRDMNIGNYYENHEYYGSADIYYADVAKRFPDTRLAQEARTKIESHKGLPQVPESKIDWLVKLLPESKKNGPSIKNTVSSPPPQTAAAPGGVLR